MTANTFIIPPFSTTGIGSLPHISGRDAVALSLSSFDIPFWPQLPALGFQEGMVPQYSESMPGLNIDTARQSLWIENDNEAITRFFAALGMEGARSAISREKAAGFYAFMDAIKGRRFKILKGHITGPLTFTLGLKDQDGRYIYFNEELREIALMLLCAKARWQMDRLKEHADNVIIFIDEPILSALGSSSYMGVSPEEAKRLLSECVKAIKQWGGISGIHCCGRADWPLIIDSGVDILNFDAYEYGNTIGIYPEQFNKFLKKGGILAWGIVPTNDAIRNVDADALIDLYKSRLDELSKAIDRGLLKTNIMLTPSCGLGSRTIDEAVKALQLLLMLREELPSIQ